MTINTSSPSSSDLRENIKKDFGTWSQESSRSIAQTHRFLGWISIAAIFAAIVGIQLQTHVFAKIKIGPFYSLEFLFLMALPGVFLNCRGPLIQTWVRHLWPVLAFGAWGFLLFIRDVFIYNPDEGVSISRFMQHCLIFLYPVMWVSLGYWLVHHHLKAAKGLVVAIVTTTLWFHIWSFNPFNYSVGSVVILPFLIFLNRLWSADAPKVGGHWAWHTLFLAVFSLVCFLPFWWMWEVNIKRTSFLLMSAMLAGAPFLVTRMTSWRQIWKPLANMAIPVLILAIGCVFVTYKTYFKSLIPETPVAIEEGQDPNATPGAPGATPGQQVGTFRSFFKQHFLVVAQHGEDLPTEANPRPFQMKTRKFLWGQTLEDWSSARWLGLGWIPEVPSEISPDVPNKFTVNGPPMSVHNSYLAVLARTGIIGMTLFTFLIGHFLLSLIHMIRTRTPFNHFELVTVFLVINGAIHAFFNVGFESPHYCLAMWVGLGIFYAIRFNDPLPPQSERGATA